MRSKSGLLLLVGIAGIAACDNGDDETPCDTSGGNTCIWAGVDEAGHNAAFNGDGLALEESNLYWPVDVTFASTGAYVLDWNNHKVRRVTAENTFETVIGSDFVGDGDAATADLMAPGVDGNTVSLNHPTQIHESPDGSLLLVAWHNHKLRHYDPETGLVYVTCGRGAGFAPEGTPVDDPMTFKLNQPAAGLYAPDGTFYIVDQRNQRVRAIGTDNTINTVVGTPDFTEMMKPDGTIVRTFMPGFDGDGGPAIDAKLSFPTGSNPPPAGGLAMDGDGRLYIADTLNHRIRRVDFDADTIETVVGNGEAAFGGDGGAGTDASINNPRDIQFGPDGRLYIADEKNHRIRAFDPEDGTITTVVGTGNQGYGENGLDPLMTDLSLPAGVSFDENGMLYVADTDNNVIRRVQL